MITIVRVIPLVLFLCAATDAGAGETHLYRCTNLEGAVIFQKYRCEIAGEQITVQVIAHGWDQLREGEKALLANYRQQENQRRSSRSKKKLQRVSQSESRVCFGKKQRLERVQEKLRRGYKPVQGERWRSQRDEYEDYLHQFC